MTLLRPAQKWMNVKFYLALIYFMITFQELVSTGLLRQTVNMNRLPMLFRYTSVGISYSTVYLKAIFFGSELPHHRVGLRG